MSALQILSRWDASRVLWQGEAESIAEAIGKARAAGANLRGAYLRGADLGGADLGGANLRDANLRGADLGGANLRGADLGGANLRDANLGGADLGGANLDGASLARADLGDANLRDANLRGADLGGANLDGADLGGANLGAAEVRDIKADLCAVLDAAPREVDGLLLALRESRVDGSVYDGECACLVGTIANVRGCHYAAIDGLTPNCNRPIERWFLAISPDCLAKHPIVALTIEWIEEWQAQHAAAPVATEGGAS